MATDETLTRREENAQAREDARDARIERDTETLLNTTPTPVTAVDGLGVERIITSQSAYEPPQVEPDPKEVERLANLAKRLDNQKAERLAALTAPPADPASATGEPVVDSQAAADAQAAEAEAKAQAEVDAAQAQAEADAKAKKGNG